MTIYERAMEYFKNHDPILNVTMSECVVRGNAIIDYADEDGVLLRYSPDSSAYLLTADSLESGKKLVDMLPECDLICHTLESLVPYIKEKFGFCEIQPCYVAANMKRTILKRDDNFDIHMLSLDDIPVVCEHYHGSSDDNVAYIKERITGGYMFGAYSDSGMLMGFVGIHSEGACGMLEVIPQYRRRGIASALERYISNHLAEKGYIAFGHIIDGNEASLSVQRSIGLDISKDKLYWQFND